MRVGWVGGKQGQQTKATTTTRTLSVCLSVCESDRMDDDADDKWGFLGEGPRTKNLEVSNNERRDGGDTQQISQAGDRPKPH